MPLEDTSLTSAQSCWTLETFSGNLFNNGQLPELFTPCVTGDVVIPLALMYHPVFTFRCSPSNDWGISKYQLWYSVWLCHLLVPVLSKPRKPIAAKVNIILFTKFVCVIVYFIEVSRDIPWNASNLVQELTKYTIKRVQAELAHTFTPQQQQQQKLTPEFLPKDTLPLMPSKTHWIVSPVTQGVNSSGSCPLLNKFPEKVSSVQQDCVEVREVSSSGIVATPINTEFIELSEANSLI